MTHICVSKLTIIGSDNGLSPGRRQAIIWNNAGILSIGLSGTNFSEILIKILTFSLKKMPLKVSSAKWRTFCLGLNVLKSSLCNPQKIITINDVFQLEVPSLTSTSNGSWCIGIKGEMSGTVCVTFTWDMYIYIWVVYSFCLFCCLFIIVTWWYMWCIVWQVAIKRKYRHVW